MNEVLEGLKISIQGLLITFLALGLFVLIMMALQRVFPFRLGKGERQEMDEGSEQIEVKTESTLRREDEEIATAIAVAIQTIQARERSTLGENLVAGKGRWWAKNHMAASQGNQQGKPG
jgi:Na+-transporting methylmalonyl-CoA/oxaloacetate decarboxylase gamma subunit